ncbi:MAG TPA: serine/threonine-protein kinase, partial [Pseudomonadota bacterium]|nr:serine/threonine-protein kinase [Pseudomonadota bacterium]
MLTRDRERALLERAIAAGYLSRGDITATAEVRPPRSSPTFSPHIDRLIQLGKLSPDVVRRLLRESGETAEDETSSPQSALAVTLPPPQSAAGAMDATLDGRSEEASSLRAASIAPPPAGKTLPGAQEVVSVADAGAVERFPVENWDRYELIKLLGQGGMGSVYKGRDRRLGRLVALKFIRSTDAQMTARFMQEARAQSRIEHPGICKVFEVGEINDKAYIVMQYVEGQPLGQAARQMTLLEKVQVVKDIAEALHTAHELGIIHRDIKPSNIMVERVPGKDGGLRSHPIVLDFGLAREAHEGKGLTESGAVMGTPAYMSPEQARGEIRSLDRRADVYSLGATLYDLLSGTAPFEDESIVNVLLKVLNDDVRPLRDKHPDVPEALDVIVGKCLNKEPAQRYQTAQELADDLGRFLNNQRIVGKQVSLWYRLRYRSQRNKPVAALIAALCVAGCGFVGYGTRTYLQNVRKEREARRKEVEAKRRAELAEQLGQTVQELEWLLRVTNGLPLHDTSGDARRVRERMAEVARVLTEAGPLAAGLGNYVLGRGHLALYEWEPALQQLRAAEAAGVHDAELDYALGRVLGELYMEGMDRARKSGDKSFQERRRAELQRQYLQPALQYLSRSRGKTRESASYAEALIDFYNQNYESALINAHMAQKQTPWLYEAKKLEGDVFAARALIQKDRGDLEQAERNYLEAVHRYEQAAEVGRSDHRIYEAIAEAWVRQEEIRSNQGQDPTTQTNNALNALNLAINANPNNSLPYTKKSYAYIFLSRYHQSQGNIPKSIDATKHLVSSAEQAIALDPNDEYAHDALGNGLLFQWMIQLPQGNQAALFQTAVRHYRESARCNSNFPWAHNDLGVAFMIDGQDKLSRNVDPTQSLESALSAFDMAIALDEKYSFAFSNKSFALNLLATWNSEHGKDPIDQATNSIKAGDAAIDINRKSDVATWNAAWANCIMIYHNTDINKPSEKYITEAKNRFEKLFSINNNIIDSYIDASRCHYWSALSFGVSPEARQVSIREGLSTSARCIELNHGPQSGCMAVEGLLLSLQGQQQAAQGRAPLPSLAKALERARGARERAPKDSTVLLSVAETCLRLAEIKAGLGQPATGELREGLLSAEQTLNVAAGWPRALAIQGALLVLSARGVRLGPEQRAILQRAQAALKTGFAGNPLLKHRYGAALS